MLSTLAASGSVRAGLRTQILRSRRWHRQPLRSLFGLARKADDAKQSRAPPPPVLSQDDLFHPLSRSPFPALKQRAEAVKKLAPCPVCAKEHAHGIPPSHSHANDEHSSTDHPRRVSFECPECGWPSHCCEDHWAADQEHARYCSRLKEVNEDEHDLRSGRKMKEFELPGV